jgi:hypothetical protein
VEGQREEVRPDPARSASEERGGALARGLRAAGRGTAWLGRRLSGWMDFNFDNDQVIPTERERREKEEKKNRR